MELEGVAPSSPVCRAGTLLLSYSPDLVEPEGVAPSSPACRTGILLLNHGSVASSPSMVGVTGIAPATSRSRTARSAAELHPEEFSRGERGTRTPNTVIPCTRLAGALLVHPDSLHVNSWRREEESNPQVTFR